MKKIFTLNNLTSGFFYLSILLFLIGFNFTDTPPPSGWYQQFMPSLGGRQISDIFFLDSLTGWAVTPYLAVNDTSYVLKTTNGGDNWFIQHSRIGQYVGSNKIKFLNLNTGYTAGASNLPAYSAILKTTNGGNNWFNINPPTDPFDAEDISILSEDTIWVVMNESLTGGVFFTSNGGQNWTQQFSGGTQNPNQIYMFNRNIGFITNSSAGLKQIYCTANSGQNWTLLNNNESFTDIYFVDSVIGWKCSPFGMKKTTDGGHNWVTETLPGGGIIQTNGIGSFSVINKDTIWGNGGYVLYPNNHIRQFLNRTTDGGNTWLIQIPDTSIIDSMGYSFVNFTNKLNGWAIGYKPISTLNRGEIHTLTGGDTNFLTGIRKITTGGFERFTLAQNYPNPFNPTTHIRYKISNNSYVKLVVYNIEGKVAKTLVDQEQAAGEYQVKFDGSELSSGVYFYSLTVDGKLIDTKKMVILK